MQQIIKRIIRKTKIWLNTLCLRKRLIEQIKILQDRDAFNLPQTVSLETTNYCNANCTYCPYGLQRPNIQRQEMGIDFSEHLIDQCAGLEIKTIDFTGFNEPLTDKRLIERIVYAKKAGIANTILHTNASLLNDDTSKDLIQSGIDEIHMSVDGLSKAAFNKIRTRLNYDIIRSNIKTFMQTREKLNMKKPKIYLSAALTKEELVQDKTEHIKHWRHYVDEILYVPVVHWAYERVKEKGHIFPCHSLWSTMNICVDARVRLCCMDFKNEFILGDLKKSSIVEIWNSEKMNQIREVHLKKFKKNVFYCDTCYETRHHDNWRFVKGIKI